jgi:hypothetical protein
MTQLIARNMSAPYISIKASNIHFRFMEPLQTPNLRFLTPWSDILCLVEVRHTYQESFNALL